MSEKSNLDRVQAATDESAAQDRERSRAERAQKESEKVDEEKQRLAQLKADAKEILSGLEGVAHAVALQAKFDRVMELGEAGMIDEEEFRRFRSEFYDAYGKIQNTLAWSEGKNSEVKYGVPGEGDRWLQSSGRHDEPTEESVKKSMSIGLSWVGVVERKMDEILEKHDK